MQAIPAAGLVSLGKRGNARRERARSRVRIHRETPSRFRLVSLWNRGGSTVP